MILKSKIIYMLNSMSLFALAFILRFYGLFTGRND